MCLLKNALSLKRRKNLSVSSFTENESIGPGLGTNLRSFARTDLSGSVRGKSGGMVTTKLSTLAEIVFTAVWREGRQ